MTAELRAELVALDREIEEAAAALRDRKAARLDLACRIEGVAVGSIVEWTDRGVQVQGIVRRIEPGYGQPKLTVSKRTTKGVWSKAVQSCWREWTVIAAGEEGQP